MKWSSKYTAHLAILASITIAFELIGLPQPITGPLVNAMLLLTALIINTTAGVMLGCITPVVAILRGQLPPALAPMIPFIVLANSVFVVVFGQIHHIFFSNKQTRKRYLINIFALFASSLCKFLLLVLSVNILLPVFFGTDIPEIFIAAMTFTQFFTAMIGGLFALFLFKLLMKLDIVDNNLCF